MKVIDRVIAFFLLDPASLSEKSASHATRPSRRQRLTLILTSGQLLLVGGMRFTVEVTEVSHFAIKGRIGASDLLKLG